MKTLVRREASSGALPALFRAVGSRNPHAGLLSPWPPALAQPPQTQNYKKKKRVSNIDKKNKCRNKLWGKTISTKVDNMLVKSTAGYLKVGIFIRVTYEGKYGVVERV